VEGRLFQDRVTREGGVDSAFSRSLKVLRLTWIKGIAARALAHHPAEGDPHSLEMKRNGDATRLLFNGLVESDFVQKECESVKNSRKKQKHNRQQTC
jgi:hypothetical protein